MAEKNNNFEKEKNDVFNSIKDVASENKPLEEKTEDIKVNPEKKKEHKNNVFDHIHEVVKENEVKEEVKKEEHKNNVLSDTEQMEIQSEENDEDIKINVKAEKTDVTYTSNGYNDFGNTDNLNEDDLSSYSNDENKKKMSKEDRKAQKRYNKIVKKRRKEKAERNGCLFRLAWVVMILVIAGFLGTFAITGIYDMLAISRQDDTIEVIVEVPKDATLDEITDLLEEKGVISEPFFFELYANATNATENYLEGAHTLDTNMDYEAILNTLLYDTAPKEYVTVQFTEGLTVREYAQILEEENICPASEFLSACDSDMFDEDYEFLADLEYNEDRVYKLEGYLFPDTYYFYLEDDVENVIAKFLDNFNKKVFKNTKKYSGYDEEMSMAEVAQDNGMSIDDLVNMASLAQAEAANENDMYYVTSIFYNRLATDFNSGYSAYGDGGLNYLQSDATIYYPYSSLEDIPEEIADTFKSNYNTYDYALLPPGAVCNPGLTALDAALNPQDTSYYYFCHKAATETEAAEAFYAYTLYEHNQNLVKAGLV